MQPQSRLSQRFLLPAAVIIALPAAVLIVNLVVWGVGASRSGFWADDFLNLTHFYHSLGHLSDDQINTGKYIINLFWAIGTEAFGTSSVIPFLVTETIVFGAGVFIWLRAGAGAHWTTLDGWWIAGLFIATGAWYPTTLWASNITHAGGFLALGVAMWAHRKCLAADTRGVATAWSVVSGLAWLGAVVSNLLYIGLLVIAAYCALHQIRKIRGLGVSTTVAVVMVAGCSLLLPLVYFLTVAYPATTAHGPYTSHGLTFVHKNFLYYEMYFASMGVVKILYIIVALACIIGAVMALRTGDFFPLAVFVAALSTSVPALVQGQQQEVNYMAMPLMLGFSSLVAGLRSVLRQHRQTQSWPKAVALGAGIACLVLLFAQASTLRIAYADTPLGGELSPFRSEVARLTPEGAFICARLEFDAPTRATFIAEMEGPDGFQVYPIEAAQAVLVAPGQACPPGSIGITVKTASRGGWTASA